MKRKFALFNLALMALVQLTIAYQSFHAFSHKHTAETHTHEAHAKESHNLTADIQHGDDDCHICDFHFDFFVAPPQFCLTLNFAFTPIPYSYSNTESATFFAGSLFALRAPPVLA
ncbi:hypothetical protein FMM05_18120 [Flavobacterium zepuense]|uniref:DUF2946 domain-containing protein n=1 Tax=Flavobacterium zepuense TaxID=2593302 RepID=A0A552UW98_9FLAO|nr:hypothetical protein [Flavobacterium zepuense]TRW22420.1 hypothetical protein FMM05_18120 [Flavobacterium zepuense]